MKASLRDNKKHILVLTQNNYAHIYSFAEEL